MSEAIRLLGLDVGGSKCAALVGDDEGLVIERREVPTLVERGPEEILTELVEIARDLLRRRGPVRAAGVSIGGPLDVTRGVVHGPPNLPGWDNLPLKARLEAEFGVPVRVEHDAAAAALAEHRWGAGSGASRLAFLTCGSGFGVGLMLDNAPYHGADGRSIEIGHVRYRDDGPVAFGKRGSFEAFGAGNGLPGLAAWRFPNRFAKSPPRGEELAALAGVGDAEAREVLALNARAVGDACALLGDLLGLDRIVLGSLARYLGEPWLEQVRRRFEEQALPWIARGCAVVPAGLGARLQDLAALVVALDVSPEGEPRGLSRR